MTYRVQKAREIRAAETVMSAACVVDKIMADMKRACSNAVEDALYRNMSTRDWCIEAIKRVEVKEQEK